MIRKAAAVIAVLIAVCLSAGCARARGVLLFAEDYWGEILRLDPEFRPTLERLAARSGLALSIIESPKGGNYFEELRQTLTADPRELVITGPLLSAEVVRLAPLFPKTRFAVLGMPRLDAAVPANVVPIYPGRGAAFHEAGRLTGEALAGSRFPDLGRKIGVISAGRTRQERELLLEFERGLSAVYDAEAIVTEEIGTTTDQVKAVRAVENLINQDVKIILVKAYGLNSACLEKIVASGVYFIVEDYGSFNLFPEKMFLTIEDDYEPVLSELLREDRAAPRPAPLLPGRVRRGALLRETKGK